MSITAGEIVTRVRDQIPDPSYDSVGNATPAADGGLFRAQTLYRWLNDGVIAAAQKVGWIINDWTALAVSQYIPHYVVDEKWHSIETVFLNGWQLGAAPESSVMWPNKVEASQGVAYSIHNVTGQWSVRIYPAPSTADPTTTLNGSITASSTSIVVTSSTGFLPYGFITIDSELIQYYNVSGNTLSGLVRGVGGTTAASHSNGATVAHKSLWIYGNRLPATVSASTDVIELPLAFVQPLQDYVLARCRESENEFQEARGLMAGFNQECMMKAADPQFKQSQGLAIRPYGSPTWGAMAWGRSIVK